MYAFHAHPPTSLLMRCGEPHLNFRILMRYYLLCVFCHPDSINSDCSDVSCRRFMVSVYAAIKSGYPSTGDASQRTQYGPEPNRPFGVHTSALGCSEWPLRDHQVHRRAQWIYSPQGVWSHTRTHAHLCVYILMRVHRVHRLLRLPLYSVLGTRSCSYFLFTSYFVL